MLNSISKFVFSSAVLFVGFVGKVAHACASCGFQDQSNNYFLGMIAIMTTVPVVLVGGTVLYIKKHRSDDDSDEK